MLENIFYNIVGVGLIILGMCVVIGIPCMLRILGVPWWCYLPCFGAMCLIIGMVGALTRIM